MIQCFKMGTGVGVFRLKIYAYVNASKLLRCFCCLNSPVCFAYLYRPTTKVMVSVVSVCLFLGFPVLGPNRSPIHTPQQGPRPRYHPSPSPDMFKFVHYEARTVVSGWHSTEMPSCLVITIVWRMIEIDIITHLIGILCHVFTVDVHYTDNCIIIFGLTLEKIQMKWAVVFTLFSDCYIDSG